MSSDKKDRVEKRIEELEQRLKGLEDNVGFIKDLLSHIHQQFQQFKQDIENRR
jgi:chromosome segregation ATPase